jgi:hypothetical protein
MERKMSHGAKLTLQVEYPVKQDELKEHDVSREETIGSVKSRVLTAFGLTEGVDEHGQLLTYTLFHHHSALTDPAVTLGSVAGDKDELRLRLDRDRHYFFYDKLKIVSALEKATGLQIKQMIKAADPKFPTDHVLIEEGHAGHEDKIINDGDIVNLEVDAAHPAKHFFSKPPTNFGAAE